MCRLGVGFMSFSADSKRLVSVGLDMDHSLALWASSTGHWSDAILFAHAKVTHTPQDREGYYVMG